MEPSRKRPAAQAARTGQAPDADARYTGKYHRSYYGNNAHVGSDGEHQLIRVAVITSANASVADLLEHVAPTDAGSLYADKAYDTKANQAWVRQRSVESQISKKGAHPLNSLSKTSRRIGARVACAAASSASSPAGNIGNSTGKRGIWD